MRPVWLLRFPIGILLMLAPFGSGCGRPSHQATETKSAGPPWFIDVTQESGLNFVHEVGSVPLDQYFLPHLMGSGAAIFDFDNDGRPDIYLIQNGGPGSQARNRLFHQGADGRFTDVSKGSGLDIIGHGMGVAVGDVNNDGWPDVLVTEYGGIRLFLNNGNGTFTDVTRQAGLENPLWATSACFVDYDRDGWLDLVVTNYLDNDPTRSCTRGEGYHRDFCGPRIFPGTVSKLYRNLGKASRGGVRFEDVTLKSGLGQLPGPGLGVICADFNGDGWPDILIANDNQPNRLWINQRDGTFKDEAVLRGLAHDAFGQALGNMGIALGDMDGDGLFDIFITHLTEETHTLWQQGPQGFFQDRTALAGIAGARWRGTGFGTALVDFDQDGWPDIAVVNGKVARGLAPPAPAGESFWAPYAERNQLFANDGSGRFRDISLQNEPFCATPAVARGLAYGDLNGDGATDLLVTTVAGPARTYRNVAPNRGHWLSLRVIDPALGGRDAYGAEITVEAGRRRWKRWVNPGSSYLCSNDPRAHFGLGAAERVDRILVLWPDGQKESFPGLATNQAVVLRKGTGTRQSIPPSIKDQGTR
jgi:enediyne biosynthesis protein E4